MTKISTLSDQPFSFSQWNRIFGVKNHNFFEPGQNIGIFASATKGMDTFLFEMSMKLMFTFKNFRNVYWHGTQHSAMSIRPLQLYCTAVYCNTFWGVFKMKLPLFLWGMATKIWLSNIKGRKGQYQLATDCTITKPFGIGAP